MINSQAVQWQTPMTCGMVGYSPSITCPLISTSTWPVAGSYTYSFNSFQSLFPGSISMMYRKDNNTIWEARYSPWNAGWQWKSEHEILPIGAERVFNLPYPIDVCYTRETRSGILGQLLDGLFGERINEFRIHNWDGSTLLEKNVVGKIKLGWQQRQAPYGDRMTFMITDQQPASYQQPVPSAIPQVAPASRPAPRVVRFIPQSEQIMIPGGAHLIYDILVQPAANQSIPVQTAPPIVSQGADGLPHAYFPFEIPSIRVSVTNPRIVGNLTPPSEQNDQ
jgi:hypothetical protein